MNDMKIMLIEIFEFYKNKKFKLYIIQKLKELGI